MRYSTLPLPYDYWTRQLTPGSANQALKRLASEIPVRIQNISEYIKFNRGVSIVPNSPDEVLNKLTELVASLGALRRVSTEELEERLSGLTKEAKEVWRAASPSDELDEETVEMIFDGALLWGEAFRLRYPVCQWTICRTPVSSVDYGQPILVRPNLKHVQFGPVCEFHGEVGLTLHGNQDRRGKLSKIIGIRAYEFGLDRDPRL